MVIEDTRLICFDFFFFIRSATTAKLGNVTGRYVLWALTSFNLTSLNSRGDNEDHYSLKNLNVMNVEILWKNGSELMQILGVGPPPPHPFGCFFGSFLLDNNGVTKVFFYFDFYWRLSLKFTWPTDCLCLADLTSLYVTDHELSLTLTFYIRQRYWFENKKKNIISSL